MRAWQLVAFLLVNMVFALGILLIQARKDNELENLQFSACVRANQLRAQGNERTYVLRAVIAEAADARRRGNRDDQATAARYDELRKRLNIDPLINCEEATRR